MMRAIALLVLVIGSVSSSPAANYFLDSLLRGPLQNQLRISGLLPAHLSNFNTEFEDKVIFIGKVKGKANYTKGELFGLDNVVRASECNGPSYSFGARHINCTIAFTSLNTSYKAKVKYGKLPNVNINARANITRTVVFVDFVQHPSQPTQVGKFQFYEVGQVHPKFTGLGSMLNKFLKVLEDGYKSHVSAEYFNTLNQNFQTALNLAAGHVPMPQ